MDQSNSLRWLDVGDPRLDWLNVADWEPRGGGLQPVRVPKHWRDRWPERTAWRAMSAAGVALRLRTDSKKLLLRVTFIDSGDSPASPAVAWERSRPSFFSLYRDGKYCAGVPALTQFTQQDVVIYQEARLQGETEIKVLFRFTIEMPNWRCMPSASNPERGFLLPRPTRAREFYFTAIRSPMATE